MYKNFIIALLGLIYCLGTAQAADSLSISKKFIGPPQLVIPPPVDSALLRKLLISDRLKSQIIEKADFLTRQNILQFRSLLRQTETLGTPNAESMANLEESLSGYIKTGDLKGQSLIYNTFGVYYGNFGQPDKAIYYFTEALKLKERLKDHSGMIQVAENLTALYKLAEDYNKAIFYAEYVVSGNQQLKNTAKVAHTYLDIASMKLKQEKYTESEYFILRKAFPLFQRTGNKVGRMNSFQALAELYFQQNRLSEAKWFYLQSQIMAIKLNDVYAKITSLTGLANVKNALGESTDALQDYHQAEQLALQNNYLVNLVEINANLGEMYSQLGDYPAAGAALDLYNRFRENWLNSNKL